MAGLLQFYFFPTDFYYPKPQLNINTNAQQHSPLPAVPALQSQDKKNQELAPLDDGGHHLNIENKEKPSNGSISLRTKMMQDSCNKVILEATNTGGRKPNRDLVRTVMFEDYGF